ncbi:MAG: hypothetical protein U0Q12_07000 [Vicinamibacterales bacterium]
MSKKKKKADKSVGSDEPRKLAKDLRLSLKLRRELDRTFVALERAIEGGQGDTSPKASKKSLGGDTADLQLALKEHKIAVRALAYGEGTDGF